MNSEAMTVSAYTIRPLTGDELTGRLLQQALWTFAGGLGYRSNDSRVAALASAMRRHVRHGGFRAFGALSERGRLVGFSYGYTSQPGLWWREQIARPLSEAQREYWLADAFELAELHVHPSVQGQHFGSRLHDALIQDAPQRTALLSVMHRSHRARQLYARRGWQTLIEDLRFSTEPSTPFSVLGLTL
jgi:ribosomal protein S18 acetylase RimI-like enzyme